MTVKEIAEKLGLAPVSVTDDTREVQGGYAGDLLSWVMGRVPEGAAWVTIMTNVNVVAEGSEIPADVIERAREQEVNLYSAAADVYTVCAALSRLLE